MIQNSDKAYARGYGKLPLLAAVRFTPANGVNPTIVHSAGIETVTWVSEGVWDCVLSNDVLDVLPSGFPFAHLFVGVTGVVDATADEGHFLGVVSMTESTGTIRVCHKADTTDAWSFQDVQGLTGVLVLVYALEA